MKNKKKLKNLGEFLEFLSKDNIIMGEDKSKELTLAEVKERLDNFIDLYTNMFCLKHDIYFNGWIGYIKGGIGEFADMFLSFEDIRLDLEYDCPTDYIYDWYWSNVDNQGKSINYYSYIKGLRIKDIKDIK
jgi:hypothetical protein